MPRIWIYHFEVSGFFKEKMQAILRLRKNISLYAFGIYITDTLVKYGCQWFLFRFNCILHPKQKVQKPFAMKVTQTLCILDFSV